MPLVKIEKIDSEDFKIPKWMDCSWRRISCGQDDCPICGRIKRDRQKHIDKGEDPDAMSAVMEDVGNNFKEILATIKDDAMMHGIEIDNIEEIKEPPEPEVYPLYLKLLDWRKDIYRLAEESDETNSAWLYSVAGQDLMWYANTVLIKTYRQLSNRWHLDCGDQYGEADYEYTKYVLEECLKIIKNALRDLSQADSEFSKRFNLALIFFEGLETEITKI